jgi:Ras GTPase-activating-like protein IQGAP2/3
MFALNPFVEDNKARINRFLNELCETSDFHERLELDQYMALSRKEIKLSITLNEIYNTHALLLQHLDELAPEKGSHLREILHDLSIAPPQVPRSENRTIELPLFSRYETPVDMTIATLADNTVTQSDLLFMETKSIFVHIVRSIPGLTRSGGRGRGMILKEGISLTKIAEMAATSKDGTLVKKGIKVKEILRELEELNVVNKSDGYKVLLDEMKEELVHLGNLRDKVASESESLQAVYKTICDHNEYLKSQLESYKAYLQNVRSQASSAPDGRKKEKLLGPYKFTHQQLEKEGVILESNVPEGRQPNIFFNLSSPSPGTFIIALHYKGRDKAILEMDLKLDDLLEKQQDNVPALDLEYVQLSVSRLLTLLNKTFSKR